jgi:sugar phosphate permease
VNTTAQVGGALGLAVLATLSATRTETLRAAGDSTAAALTGGYHLAFLVAAGLTIAAIAVALLVLRDGPRAEPQPLAGEEAEEEREAAPVGVPA